MKLDGRKTRVCDYHGAKNPNAKLNGYKVQKIRQLYAEGLTPSVIARMFDTTGCNISNIVARRTWRKI